MTQFPRLSNREWDVLKLLLQGKGNKQIALSLDISVRTVEFHLKNIYAKFQASSRIELILKLGSATGEFEIEKLGRSTVANIGENVENRDRLNLRKSWAGSFIGKEIDMKNILTSKHVLVGVMTTLFTGAMWVSALLYSQLLFPSEIKAWVAPLIIVWVIIGLTIGLVGNRYGATLQRVFFSTLLGAGLSPFTIIPLMMFVVLPIGKLAEWLGMIDPATMPNDVATNLTMIAMITIWLFVGIFIGIILLFLTIKKPEQAKVQAQFSG